MQISLGTRIIIFVGSSIILCSVVASGIYYRQYVRQLDNDIQEKLATGIMLAKELTDMNGFDTLTLPESQGNDYYAATMSQLVKIRNVFHFRSVYLIKFEKGRWIILFDTGVAGNINRQNRTSLAEYENPPAELSSALTTGTITMAGKPRTDGYGTFLSAFLPVKIGGTDIVIGADFDIKDVKHRKNMAFLLFAGIICGILVIAAALIFYLRGIILKPILGIINSISRSAKSRDLTRRIEVKSADEMGRLASNFNSFIESSAGFLKELSMLTDEMASASEQLAGVSSSFTGTTKNQADGSGRMIGSIEKISDLINNIAGLSGEQLEIFVSQRKLIGELYDGIKNVNTQADMGMELSETVAGRARNGEVSLTGINASMGRLMDSSGDMIKIIEIINDISDRINLLSLNASIEAARAGDAGRGFAVVAEEISKLADQTASSTKNIDSLIRVNSDEITREIENINATTRILTEIIEGVSEMKSEVAQMQQSTREQLSIAEKVRNNAGNIFRRAEDINMIAGTQKGEVDEINRSVSDIGNLNQSVVSGAGEIASSSERIAAMALRLRERISLFRF